jgi:hypothetical protein
MYTNNVLYQAYFIPWHLLFLLFCKLGGVMQSASYSCSTEIYIRLLAGLSFGL